MKARPPASEAEVSRCTTPPATVRILWVFAWLVVGGEETEVRLLARNLDRSRYRIDVLPCLRREGMPEQTRRQLQEIGVAVDTAAYDLSFEDTIAYLARRIPEYDLVVASQAVPDVYPALELLRARGERRPPLIEHGGLVTEALRGPKHLTNRYVGVCRTIRDAAASRMPDRPHHALQIPSMVDLEEFDPARRADVRRDWGVADHVPVVGWVGRLDRKKRVEDFVRAAAMVRETHPSALFLVIGGPDAFMPEYADELRLLAADLRVDGTLRFLGDRPDVPRLLAGVDILVWLSRDEGMPHVISEAGAAALPVVATRDNGSEEQITDGETGLFVPHEEPASVAAALRRLLKDPALRRRLGDNLRRKVEREYSTDALVRRWLALFEEVVADGPR